MDSIVKIVAGISSMFASEPETLPVFMEWAKTEHMKVTPECSNPNCIYTMTTPEGWRKLLKFTSMEMLDEVAKEQG